MPARVGFTQFRRQALERELERISQMFPQLGVQLAILIGDLATEQVHPDSSLDLIIVQDVPGNFTRRSDFFTSHLDPMVSSKFYVYTPEEFQKLKETSIFLSNAIGKGRIVHES